MHVPVVVVLIATLCGQRTVNVSATELSRPTTELFSAARPARVATVAMAEARSEGSSDSEPKSAAPDNAPPDKLDIPWPSLPRDSASESVDAGKLDKIMREHNKLFADWKRERHHHDDLVNHLNKVAGNLQRLQNRADAVSGTMNKIRGIMGDSNADNADVFAPPETPRWNQSLAKTYTLRTAEMGRLNVKATRAMNEFNATLKNLDANTDKQKQTLSRAIELRGEWVRSTRPFGLWTKQDTPISNETSTHWIVTNEVFAPAYLARCVSEIRAKHYGQASEDIGLAIKRDPNWVELYALQAVLQDRAGKQSDVEKSLKAMRRLKKKSAFTEVCEGIISSRHGNFDGAKNKFESATKHDPADPAGQTELALLFLTSSKPEKRDAASAIKAATAACEATSYSQWYCLDVLALAYAASGDFERATGCIHRAKQAAPDDVQKLLDEQIANYEKKQVPSAGVGDL
jgi:Flp pilus assembly protein TadD